MKQAVLISCSDHYAHRLAMFDRVLREMGYAATYVTSDFDHTAKQRFSCAVPGCVQLPVPAYRKNLSAARILSHRAFARSVLRWLEALPEEPAVVLALLPPNYLAAYLARYKRRHPDVRLHFDIFDLWPESFPSARLKALLRLPFAVWAGLRDRNLGAADRITTECELFRTRLDLPPARAQVCYFSLPDCAAAPEPPDAAQAQIAYLGAINNLIDIPRIAAFLGALARRMPVTLHIIGDGEQRPAFCEAAQAAGAAVVYHGKIFDGAEKDAILGGCHFGLNVMKDAVCIGLTMKSVDYLRHGLPLINTIGADTASLLRQHGAGIELRGAEETAEAVAAAIRGGTQPMRLAARRLYDTLFSEQAAQASCRGALEHLLLTGERHE